MTAPGHQFYYETDWRGGRNENKIFIHLMLFSTVFICAQPVPPASVPAKKDSSIRLTDSRNPRL